MMISTTFVACSNDDNDGDDSSAIVGSWKYTGSESSDGFTFTWTEWLTFNKDNKGKYRMEDSDDDSIEFSFTWKLSGNTLKIVPTGAYYDDEIVTSFTIISVNSTTLVMDNGETVYNWTRVK